MPRVRLLAVIAVVIASLLAGCEPASAFKMHDLYLYGVENARISHFYGQPGELLYGSDTLTLTEPDPASPKLSQPYAVKGALFVNGEPYLRARLEPLTTPPITVSRIPFTTDLQVTVNADVEEVVYFDGQSFLRLLQQEQAGTVLPVVPRPRLNGLRGLGQLSNAEADALAAALASRGRPLALALLPLAALPAHPVDGLAEQRRTGVYVQLEIGTDESAYRPAPQQLPWEVVARGDQAVGFGSASYQIVTSQDQLISLWQRAYGNQLTVPALPSLDFRRETVVALFMGSRSTGGYGIDVRSVRDENGELYIDVAFTQPAAGDITTQATTSPWLILRVQRGGYAAAWLRDPTTGNLLGVARAAE